MAPPEINPKPISPDDNSVNWVAIVLGIAMIGAVFGVGDWLSRQHTGDTIVLNPRQFASATTGLASSNQSNQTLALADCQSHFAAGGTLVLGCLTNTASSQVAGEQVAGEQTTNEKPKTTVAASAMTDWWQFIANILAFLNH